MGKNLFEKVWDNHSIETLPNGQTQLLIGTHLIHEVTSPQAFAMLEELNMTVKFPERNFATADHIIPTDNRSEPFQDPLAQEMMSALRENCKKHNIKFFDVGTGTQGIVHVVGPEQGITQPGTTIACGDSHTATHGAFGAIAFGIGTTQIRDILATQTIALNKLKVRRINVDGNLSPGVYAKDVILHIIKLLGAKGGIGYAYEYGGSLIESLSMEERMTICNMSIEGGARCGYINPDYKTFSYLNSRNYSPKGKDWDRAVEKWKNFASDKDCTYDDVVNIKAEDISPSVTWGISPDQGISIDDKIPSLDDFSNQEDKKNIEEALKYMKFESGSMMKGKKVDVCFIGSCTNGRLSDFQEVAKFIKGHKVSTSVKAIAVPGSEIVDMICKKEGIDTIFKESGFEWRSAGCSMCLAMNPDKLINDQLCASSSNRNFKGRQGSPTGRTILMSPLMVAAAAIRGEISDVREVFN